MKNCNTKKFNRNCGSVLALTLVLVVILTFIGMGLLTVAYGMRIRAIKFRNETTAMLAAEAGYEKGIFWMNKQSDVMDSLTNHPSGSTGSLSFTDSSCTYSVQFHNYTGGIPIFRVTSTGTCGVSKKAVDVFVVQVVSGWDMGMCRVPNSTSSTTAVNFVTGEILNIPIHINKYADSSDAADIYISGTPDFQQIVYMGEARNTSGGSDKYSSIISLFDRGIYFSQPDVRITDATAVQDKINRFRDSTAATFKLTPASPSTSVTSPRDSAVQLEFYVTGGVGRVRITNNCTVKTSTGSTYDYMIDNPTAGTYKKYNIYNYHYSSNSTASQTYKITDTYVTQTFNGQQSPACGQIYVVGNVIIGGSGTGLPGTPVSQVLQGKLTVVAAKDASGNGGNIWIADSITIDGNHDANGMPLLSNANSLGLIAQNVIKVIDPGLSPASPSTYSGLTYQPIGITKSGSSGRFLPDPTVVEAAVTVGGGGWGAENVNSNSNSYGDYGRREYPVPSGLNDTLILRGSICEAIRGVVGLTGTDGYVKQYYLDRRLLQGVLPSNVWFSGKYVPAPAGWKDYRPSN